MKGVLKSIVSPFSLKVEASETQMHSDLSCIVRHRTVGGVASEDY